MGPVPAPADNSKTKWDDKLAALRSQRRAQGLCMKCGEKWGKQHKCPDKVSMNVLEEFLDIIQPEQQGSESSDESCEDEDADVFVLSQCAQEGVQGKKTIKLSGIVDKQEILILVDSGSSCTFLSEKAAQLLNCKVTAASPVSVTVANGHKLTSDK